MDIKIILAAILSLGGMGVLFGVILAIAGKMFEVKTDERIPQIIECLPGANCGGCGFAGCAAYAAAVATGTAAPSCCPVGGETAGQKIAEIMGLVLQAEEKRCAIVHCCGTDAAAVKKYEYEGICDCTAAMRLGGGSKACPYSCTGLGSCVEACKFDAIHVVDGVAVVDEEKCTSCGACVLACPKNLITLIPVSKPYYVGCLNKDKGVITKNDCAVGCIACRICEKECPSDAIHVIDNCARIDYDKCTACGACVEKCPKKIIRIAAYKTEKKVSLGG